MGFNSAFKGLNRILERPVRFQRLNNPKTWSIYLFLLMELPSKNARRSYGKHEKQNPAFRQ